MTNPLAAQIKPGAYLIFGLPGTGKSAVAKALQKLDLNAIEADTKPDLSAWVNIITGHRLASLPGFPFTRAWRNTHRWQWDKENFDKILQESNPIFFCGNADNIQEFFPSFRRRFALYVDNETMSTRLKARDSIRWNDHDPELAETLGWNSTFVQSWISNDITLVNANQPIDTIINEIVAGASV